MKRIFCHFGETFRFVFQRLQIKILSVAHKKLSRVLSKPTVLSRQIIKDSLSTLFLPKPALQQRPDFGLPKTRDTTKQPALKAVFLAPSRSPNPDEKTVHLSAFSRSGCRFIGNQALRLAWFSLGRPC